MVGAVGGDRTVLLGQDLRTGRVEFTAGCGFHLRLPPRSRRRAAVLVILAALADRLEQTFGPELPPQVRAAYLAILLALALMTMYSAVPLMVRGVINGLSAFWRGVGRTTSSATPPSVTSSRRLHRPLAWSATSSCWCSGRAGRSA